MKIFILFLIISIVTAEYKVKSFDDLMKYHDECGAAHYTPAEMLVDYKEQKYRAGKDSYCHVHCLAKKIGVFDDEHAVKVDNWIAQVVAANNVTVDEVKPKIIACVEEIAQYKDYPCLWAFKGFMCTKNAGWEVIKVPDLSSRSTGYTSYSSSFSSFSSSSDSSGAPVYSSFFECVQCFYDSCRPCIYD